MSLRSQHVPFHFSCRTFILVSVFLLGGWLFVPSVQAALNDTGLTACFSDTANLGVCSDGNSGDGSGFPRQDARFGRDAAQAAGKLLPAKTGGGAAAFDFSKICNNGGDCSAQAAPGLNPADWGCTRDNVTGLLWSVWDEGAMDWNAATSTSVSSPIAIANGAAHCGVSNWRVPTRRELISLLYEGSAVAPQIDTNYFPNTSSAIFWASETIASALGSAWHVDFGVSGALSINASSKTTNTLHVRLVSGVSLPAAAFIDNGDGTVSDSSTGLMWDQCLLGLSGSNCATGSFSTLTWQQALQAVVTANSSAHLGYRDWRLPNRNEMESPVGLSVMAQAFDSAFFPSAVGSAWLWTSTSYAPDPAQAWMIASVHGDGKVGSKAGTASIRLVRGGATNSDVYDAQALNVDVAITPGTTAAQIVFSNATASGTLYGIVLPAGSSAPNFTAVLAGTQGTVTAGGGTSFAPSSLSAATAYRLYIVTLSASGTYGPIQSYPFSTLGAPILSAQSISAVTTSGATFSVSSDIAATGYWVVLPAANPDPAAALIVAQALGNTGSMSANTAFSRTLSGLSPNTAYKLHFVADSGGSTYSAVWSVSFTTPVLTAPILSGFTVTPTGSDSATFSVVSNIATNGYWLVLPAGDPAPNTAQVTTGGNTGAMAAGVAFSHTLSGLSPGTAYKFYFVAGSGVLSGVLSASFSTPANVTPTPPTPPAPLPDPTPSPGNGSSFSDDGVLKPGNTYTAPSGTPGFCLGDTAVGSSIQVRIDNVPYTLTARSANTCFQIFTTGNGSERALIISRGSADISTVSPGKPLLLARNGDLVMNDANNAGSTGAAIRATVDPVCTSTRINTLAGKVSAPEWITSAPPASGCPADALTPPRNRYAINDGLLACDPAALTVKGTYSRLTVKQTQDLTVGERFYVVAWVPQVGWFQNGAPEGWRSLQDPFTPLVSVAAAGPTTATLIDGWDIRGIKGTELYIGYGKNVDDLMTNRRYCGVFKIAP